MSFLSACQRDQFPILPPNVTYVPLGADVTVTLTHVNLNPNNLQVRRTNANDSLQCTTNPMCTLDVDSGMFTLHDFQSSYNGTYLFDYVIAFPRSCFVYFDIIEAGKFKLYILHSCSKLIDSLHMSLVLWWLVTISFEWYICCIVYVYVVGRLVGHADMVCPVMYIILRGISAYLLLQALYTELCHCV